MNTTLPKKVIQIIISKKLSREITEKVKKRRK
jgi:hypothetical protein